MSSCHTPACDTTAPAASGQLPSITLAGNPNCGKTTVFNLLTGARQQVGNWPGVTVERRSGTAQYQGQKYAVIDLPGVYSLLGGGGTDQKIARDFVLTGDTDIIVNIIDASNLERHLILTEELLAVGKPMLVILNMVDEAQRLGLDPQADILAQKLGVPVVPMVARKGRGKDELFKALAQVLAQHHPGIMPRYEAPVEAAIATVAAAQKSGSAAQRRFEALRFLEERAQPPQELAAAVAQAREEVSQACDDDAADVLAAARFAWANDIAAQTLLQRDKSGARTGLVEKLDRIVLHDWVGVPVFLLVLYLVFVVSYNGGKIFQDFFDKGSEAVLVGGVGHLLWRAGLPDWVVSVMATGVGGGITMVMSFIPPIGLTFLFLALLDDCGYMARAAYAMDRLMRRFGLPGNALVPMVIGFGCNVPAIMGARIIEDPRGRLLTVLMQPFMSCSARLTIYMAFALVFFKENGGQVVFLLYVLGIVAALLTALLLGKTAIPGKPMPFIMELPPYRLPGVQSVLLQAWQRLKVFIFRVGKVIVVLGFLLGILPGIGITSQGIQTTDIDHSLLAQGSRALVPLFKPMGVKEDNWPAVSGLIAGAAAKEVVIGTLNGIYQRQSAEAGENEFAENEVVDKLKEAAATIPENAKAFFGSLVDPLNLHSLESEEDTKSESGASDATLGALAQAFTPLSAFAYLVFVLLYVPCASTIGALRREAGFGWMIFSTAYSTLLAWASAVCIYQIGTWAEHPGASLLWVTGCAVSLIALVVGLRLYARRAPAAATVLPVAGEA